MPLSHKLSVITLLFSLALLFSPAVAQTPTDQKMAERISWQALPDLPRPSSGQLAGVSNGALLVIGGSYFEVSIFAGGTKLWLDTVYVLEPGAKEWKLGLKLDHPLGYGGSMTTEDGVICIGGSDGVKHYAEVFRLRWVNGRVEKTMLPSLPEPCANLGAALIGKAIYAISGQSAPASTEAMNKLWVLDLSAREPVWRALEPLPGAGRILPVVAAQNGALYVISGAELSAGADGKAVRRYLNDGWRYQPNAVANKGWSRIADTPQALVAAPAVAAGQGHILVFSGDDGANAQRIFELKDNHPGFSRDVLAYHTITNTWAKVGNAPGSIVTTTAVEWQNSIVLPGGEDRPGHRTAQVWAGKLQQTKGGFGWLDYTVLGLYLLPMLLLGFYFAGGRKTTEDFFLGGRRIPWWAAGLSIYGTQLSALTFLAIPAKAYAEDWTYLLVNVCIVLIAPVVVFFYLPFFRRLAVTTAYEYLEKRFNLAVRLFGSASFIVLQGGRLAIVLFLPSLALAAVSGINIYLCILLMGVLTTVYTMEGGMEAVVWTDVIQVFVLIGGALVSLWLLIGGVDGGLSQVISMGREAGKFHMFTWTWDYTTTAVWVVLIGNLWSVLIPYTTDQAVIQRYLTTKDEKQAARAIWTNAAMTIPTTFIFFGIGTALYAFYKTHPSLLSPAVQTDATFAWFIAQQLPMGVSGLVVAGVFAAAMSTMSSSMNSIATAIVTDFYARFRPGVADEKKMRLARRLTLLLGVVGTVAALLMATFAIKSLWDLFLQVLGLFGGGLAGVFMLGIFTTRAHGRGALVGVAASTIVLLLVQRYTNVHFFLYAAVGIVMCFVVGYVASILIPAAEQSLKGLTIYTVGSRQETMNVAPRIESAD